MNDGMYTALYICLGIFTVAIIALLIIGKKGKGESPMNIELPEKECPDCGLMFNPEYESDIRCSQCEPPAHLSDYERSD
jgi:hypothetical protein